MTARKISPAPRIVTTEMVRTAQGAALGAVKARHGLSNDTMAELLGKSDAKTAKQYLAGESTMDLAAFARALNDPAFGPEFGNQVLGPLAGLNLVSVDSDGSHAPDETMTAQVADLSSALVKAFMDRRLDHQEILALAKMLRPLMPKFQFVVGEADRLNGVTG